MGEEPFGGSSKPWAKAGRCPAGHPNAPLQTQTAPCPRLGSGCLTASAAHFHPAGVSHPWLLLASDKGEKSPKMGFGGTRRLLDAIRAAGAGAGRRPPCGEALGGLGWIWCYHTQTPAHATRDCHQLERARGFAYQSGQTLPTLGARTRPAPPGSLRRDGRAEPSSGRAAKAGRARTATVSKDNELGKATVTLAGQAADRPGL